MRPKHPARFAACVFALAGPLFLAPAAASCPERERTVRFGFYAHFEPVSYSAARDPAADGFHDHRGYEADLLTALEAMEGANLSFARRGIAAWDGIWLLPAGPDYDMTGGGIAALDSRTRNAAGDRAVVFAAGHIRFRQSLLVRAEDRRRLTGYRALDRTVRVGVLAGTTGEARLLELTGLADAAGLLAAGVRIDTPRGAVTADGGAGYRIAAAGASPALEGRLRLRPASAAMPRTVYLPDETALFDALRAGRIDAVAQGDIGNRYAARRSGGALAVSAVDARTEVGGFALDLSDAPLAACLEGLIAWLTDEGRIGYGAWLEDPSVFLRRARLWPGRQG